MGYFADCGSQTSISQEDASRSQIDTLHRPPAACSHSRQLFRTPASRAETRERHEKAGGMGRGNSQQPKLRMARITRKGKVGRSRRDRRDRTAPSPQRATEEHRETASIEGLNSLSDPFPGRSPPMNFLCETLRPSVVHPGCGSKPYNSQFVQFVSFVVNRLGCFSVRHCAPLWFIRLWIPAAPLPARCG